MMTNGRYRWGMGAMVVLGLAGGAILQGADSPVVATGGIVIAQGDASKGATEAVTEGTPALTKAEQAFADLLSNSVMVGSFTIDGQDKPPREERYTIGKVSKAENGNWVVEARITYGKVDVAVPVTVQVEWGGDVPVLGVTDLTIPLVGSEFTSRILFHGNRYAGTWMHGKVGGHMFGRIERAPKPAVEGETKGAAESR